MLLQWRSGCALRAAVYQLVARERLTILFPGLDSEGVSKRRSSRKASKLTYCQICIGVSFVVHVDVRCSWESVRIAANVDCILWLINPNPVNLYEHQQSRQYRELECSPRHAERLTSICVGKIKFARSTSPKFSDMPKLIITSIVDLSSDHAGWSRNTGFTHSTRVPRE